LAESRSLTADSSFSIMLYWLLYDWLHHYVKAFNVFRYVTFRTALASLTALFLCIVLGPWLIGKLREFQIGQYIREDGPKSHQKKAGTPTMGGVLIIVSIVLPTLLWADLHYAYVWVAVAALLGFGWIGFLDDYSKIARQRNLGLTGRIKLLYQFAMGSGVAAVLLLMRAYGSFSTQVNIPFFKQFSPSLLFNGLLSNPWTYVLGVAPFCIFVSLVVVFFSNAVNLTDGLDGLAIGLTVIAAGALTVLTYAGGHATLAEYLQLGRNPHTSELTIFCGSMTGASLGFLWYNAHPAEIFMGDVGSLGLGGAMAVVAILIKQEVLLVFIGGVFILEALSVILQVGSYKLRGGKRIFKMAPLHHHFEGMGWAESKIIARFWIAGLILALFALTTLKLR
jgi:phospho-N-acetylmuramoyl-pentapeptide-transferase